MAEVLHAATVPVRCWVDIDAPIVPLVAVLNELPGLRTFSSCSGHPDSREDTRAYVSFAAADEKQLDEILAAIADTDGVVVEIRRVGHCILRVPPDLCGLVASLLAGGSTSEESDGAAPRLLNGGDACMQGGSAR